MPPERRGTYTPDDLESAANRLASYIERVRGVALRMRHEAIGQLEVTMQAAFERATTDLKRWSRGVEDALDEWADRQKEGDQKTTRKKRKGIG